jgi:hypothetical protein
MLNNIEQLIALDVKNDFLKRDTSFSLEPFILFIIPREVFHRQIIVQCVPFGNSQTPKASSGSALTISEFNRVPSDPDCLDSSSTEAYFGRESEGHNTYSCITQCGLQSMDASGREVFVVTVEELTARNLSKARPAQLRRQYYVPRNPCCG